MNDTCCCYVFKALEATIHTTKVIHIHTKKKMSKKERKPGALLAKPFQCNQIFAL